jgi:prepilin-type N-terminal cleavage/methylation domain-containing protein|tara:strand:+ start:164 stop:334 length:171 start_codon:yes stop_codon:yes gene_type:complete
MKHRVFNLIELLIVVVIIGILTTVGMIISYKTDKFQDLNKKFDRQKEYKERLYNQG